MESGCVFFENHWTTLQEKMVTFQPKNSSQNNLHTWKFITNLEKISPVLFLNQSKSKTK